MTLSLTLQKLSQEFAGQQREAHLWSSADEECPITGRHWGFVLPLGLLGTKPVPHSGGGDTCPWICTHVLLWATSQGPLGNCVAEWNRPKGAHTAGLGSGMRLLYDLGRLQGASPLLEMLQCISVTLQVAGAFVGLRAASLGAQRKQMQ